MGWTTEGSEFESRQGQELSFLHVVQTGSRVHPAYYLMGTGGSFFRCVKLTTPTSAEVKWIYTSTSLYTFMD
jgi:hypothetical protein